MVDAWRTLSQQLAELGRKRESALALAPLVFLQVASEKEIEQTRQLSAGLAQARPGALDPQVLGELVPYPEEVRPIAALIAATEPALAKLYRFDKERYGVTARDRRSRAEDKQLRQLADRVAGVLGVRRYELYLKDAPLAAPLIALEKTPKIIASAGLRSLAPTEQVFVLASALAHLAANTYPVKALDAPELRRALAAITRRFVSGHDTDSWGPEEIEDWGNKLHRATPGRRRADLAARAQDYANWAGGTSVDLNLVVQEVDRNALRLAAVLSGDLPGCLSVLTKLDPTLTDLQPEVLVEKSETAADLIQFWLSDAANAFRRKIGILEQRTMRVRTDER